MTSVHLQCRGDIAHTQCTVQIQCVGLLLSKGLFPTAFVLSNAQHTEHTESKHKTNHCSEVKVLQLVLLLGAELLGYSKSYCKAAGERLIQRKETDKRRKERRKESNGQGLSKQLLECSAASLQINQINVNRTWAHCVLLNRSPPMGTKLQCITLAFSLSLSFSFCYVHPFFRVSVVWHTQSRFHHLLITAATANVPPLGNRFFQQQHTIYNLYRIILKCE